MSATESETALAAAMQARLASNGEWRELWRAIEAHSKRIAVLEKRVAELEDPRHAD